VEGVRRDRPLAVGTALGVGLTVVYAVDYNTGDSYVYLVPVTLLLALWLAWGVPEAIAVLPLGYSADGKPKQNRS
jgi:hypothetical protein